ncbi:SDR family oxidoreductase [Paenibacillus peoriae]|uniref:SDR family oxidoreductase n=1 Tax=Paenibacillus peoriae TaxID=59893 RepID=UPI00026C6141|nr:SDR family oxidoreductase [Paenibacillus peoriae]MEC0184740.1 SDR family oxidoreductase [Paenibacillus peoriae]
MILVTGATGHLGKAVIDHLLTKVEPSRIAAFARDQSKAASLKDKGIDVRIGNFDDVASLESAMKGIHKVLLISSNDHGQLLEQHKNVIHAAKKAQVSQLVYTGTAVQDAEGSPLKAMLEAHEHTEDYIKQSSLPYTILRNTMYADTLPLFLGDKVFESGIYLPVGDGKVPFALRREMGEAAANVLLQSNHENKTYVLTGNELNTFDQIATILSELSGKTVGYISPDLNAFKEMLRAAGNPEFGISTIAGFISDMREGRYNLQSDNFEMLLGRKPMSLKNSLKEIYSI